LLLQRFLCLKTEQGATIRGSATKLCAATGNNQHRETEQLRNPPRLFSAALMAVFVRRMVMPVLLVPALFIGGTAVVLGGGYFLLHGLHVIAW
jgi:hypothetical protein